MRVVGYLIRQASGRPPGFLARRAWDLVVRSLRGLSVRFGRNPYHSRSLGSVDAIRHRDASLLDLTAFDGILARLKDHRSGEVQMLMARARRLADLEISIFGQAYDLSHPIDWQRDLASGLEWPARFHSRYRYAELLDMNRPSDIKVPWELGRLQYVTVLALAHRLTNEPRYFEVARGIIDDWDAGNPVGYGIQWVVGMEVAMRAISLVLTAELLRGTPGGKTFVTRRFMEMLEEHGRFLYRNVEYSDINGNHHTSCLLGLLYLGLWLPDAAEAASWRRRSLAGLRREILLQSFADGVCHEGSIPYHRLVTELFLHAFFLARRSSIDLGESYRQRLLAMLRFTAAYMKPSGEAPVWGDADDGRVHTLGSQSLNDHRYLLNAGSGLFGHGLCPLDAGPPPLDAALLLDQSALEELARPLLETNDRDRNQGFPEGGFYFLRTAGSYCMIDCGDVGLRGRGGHGHNDALSIEVAIQGADVLTDTGCASYTRSSRERRYTLSATSHNAPVLGDREPAPISMTRWPHATACPARVMRWSEVEGVFVGRHYGYSDLEGASYVERRVEILPSGTGFLIADRIEGTGEHDVNWRFHLARRWQDPEIDGSAVILKDSSRKAIVILRSLSGRLRLSLERKDQYPTYAAPVERWCLVATAHATLPLEATFEIVGA